MIEQKMQKEGETDMKKTIIVLAFAMAAMFCVLLAGCGSSDGGDLSDSKYVGTWKAVSKRRVMRK